MIRLVLVLIASIFACLLPSRAEAQWYAAVYLGASHTQAASVTIDQTSASRSFTFHDVHFDGEPFEAPQYYGWRIGRWMNQAKRLGVELEFIHLKVIGRTDRAYPVTGLDSLTRGDSGGPLGDGTALLMDTTVQRYAMTHGLNFALVNLVMRTPVAGPFTMTWRAGLGPTLPHAETTIDGHAREQYEYGGPGAHLSAGIAMSTWRWLSTTAEYKFTIARPRIDVAGGTGMTTSATHHVALGLAFDLTR